MPTHQDLQRLCIHTNILIKSDKGFAPKWVSPQDELAEGEGVGRSGRKGERKHRNKFNLSVHRKSKETHKHIQDDKR